MPTTTQLIEISVTRQTQAVSRAGFGTLMILGPNATFEERVRSYTSLSQVAEDFEITTPEYIMANKVLSQSPRPSLFKIGRSDIGGEDSTVTEAVQAVADYDGDWYFLLATTHVTADQQALAEWTEANSRLYFTSTQDTNALDAGVETDIGSILNGLGLDRTLVTYLSRADTQYIEAAIVAKLCTYTPGSVNWAFKNLSGVTADVITPTQELVLQGTKFSVGKGYNTYTNIGGVDMFFDGHAVGGEWIDVMRGSDALQARMRERIFGTMANSIKLDYNDDGAALIVANMRATLQDFYESKFIEGDFTVTAPQLRKVDSNLRVNRVAEGFTFTANLTGAINYVGITGTLIS